jgi:hypothetical protein
MFHFYFHVHILPSSRRAVIGLIVRVLLYLLYTTDLPIMPETTTAIIAYDTVVVASDIDPVVALH